MYSNGNSFSGSPASLGPDVGNAIGTGSVLRPVPPWKGGVSPAAMMRGASTA
jgi:hypothetical protein